MHSLIFLPSLPCAASLPFLVFLGLVSLFFFPFLSFVFCCSSFCLFFWFFAFVFDSPSPLSSSSLFSAPFLFVFPFLFCQYHLFLFSSFLFSLHFFSHFPAAFPISVPISPRFDISPSPSRSFPPPFLPPAILHLLSSPPHSPFPSFPISERRKRGREEGGTREDRRTEDERKGGGMVNGAKELE